MGRKALEVGQVSKYIAEILTRRREELGLSLRAIQAKSGVNYMRVQRVLSAEHVMTVDELEALAEALQMAGWKIMREAEERFVTETHVADVIDLHTVPVISEEEAELMAASEHPEEPLAEAEGMMEST